MNRLGLILATTLVVACWTLSVSARSLDAVAESEASQNNAFSPINVPAVLEFEGGLGDNEVGGANIRDKRTPRFIFRAVSCLFTFLLNPSCLQGLFNGGGMGGLGGLGGGSSSSGSGSSYGSSSASANRRQQASQPYYMITLPRFNESDSNQTSTEYPIYPIESTSEYPEEQPSRPTNPILAMIQWKMNLIPNLLRRFFPGMGGARRDDGGNGLGFNLGLGGGRFANLFGGFLNRFGGGGGGGFGGFGGGQY